LRTSYGVGLKKTKTREKGFNKKKTLGRKGGKRIYVDKKKTFSEKVEGRGAWQTGGNFVRPGWIKKSSQTKKKSPEYGNVGGGGASQRGLTNLKKKTTEKKSY